MTSKNFKMYVPLDRESLINPSKEHGNFVRGYATTKDVDRQDQVVLPSELDISAFLERGFINFEHQKGYEFKIGVPTANTYIDPQKGLYVEAKLFMDNPYAQKMWQLATNVAKSGASRPLGFSIEGKCDYIDPDDQRTLRGMHVEEVALTTDPANPNATWEAFIKSFDTGYSVDPLEQTGAASLRRESLAREIKNLSFTLKGLTVEDWTYIAKSLDSEERWDRDTAILFVQLEKGCSREEAIKIIDNAFNVKK